MSSPQPPTEPRRKRGRPRKPAEESGGFTDPHVLKAIGYARDVCGGKVPASKWTVLGCQRFLKDLDRAKTDAFPYRLDEDKGGRACRFVELLPHVAGPLFGQSLRLEPWQCFIQVQVWGWVVKSSGLRRFRRAQVWVPRGQGKSFLASGNALYALAADGEGGAQVVCAATKQDQARIVLDTARRQMQHASALRDKLGVEVTQHAIFKQAANSSFKALSSEAHTLDGLNLHFCVLDELHAHPKRDLFDVMVTGLGKRAQPMLLVISTAGSDQSGIGFEQYALCRRILAGNVEDERTFCALWEMDDGDDPWAEDTWRKANPNAGVSVDLDHLRQESATAQKIASARSAFLTKHLNVWVNAASPFFNMESWAKCMDPTLKREDFAGQECVVGMDLAQKHDFSALAIVFWKFIDGKRHYYAFFDCWIPPAELLSSSNASYRGWHEDGWITCPGELVPENNELDYSVVKDRLREHIARFRVREVAYDPAAGGTQLMQAVSDEVGAIAVELRASVLNFNLPMKELEAAHASGRLHVEASPLVAWMAGNCVSYRNAKDEVFPRKEREEAKIDAITALILATNRVIAQEEAPYQDGGGFREW